jgi:Uma2 family endonuclease
VTQTAVPSGPVRRGSPWGQDGVYYPDTEERTVPLSDAAVRLIFYLYMALNRVFAARPDVYVGADQFIYWVPGDPRQRLAPDGYVIFGVPKHPLRSVIRVWEEAPPVLVIEVSNSGSRSEDRGHKMNLYRDTLRVPEYLIFDDDTRELLFYRLEEGQYVLQMADDRGRYLSRATGVWFGPDAVLGVRVYGPDGVALPWTDEMFQEVQELREHRDMLTRIAHRLEEETKDLRERHERERLRADEQQARAEALEAELERLRRERDG